MSDYQYLLDYVLTVDDVEDWCRAMAEVIRPIDPIVPWYEGSHRAADEEI
jgi:hypothetical protein